MTDLSLRIAATFMDRLYGAHRWPLRVGSNRGLLLRPCSAVHTFFLPYALDVVFLDDALNEVHRIDAMPPRRMAWRRFATAVVELPEGYCDDQPDYLRRIRAAVQSTSAW